MREKIGLGGGCHWCTEAIFQSLPGVMEVEQGWISATEAANFSEAIIVHYCPHIITLATLVEIHLHTHSCTSAHSMRTKYRSAIYVFTAGQNQKATRLLAGFQEDFEHRIITRVYAFGSFKGNSETYLGYYHRNPDKPFCKNVIAPKLRELLVRFKSVVAPGIIS